MQEFRVTGPPGTGKTSYLASNARRAIEASGQQPHECSDVLMTTLTKAAAIEMNARGLGLPPGQIGTLHSHAYRALGRPQLVYSKEATMDWNEHCPERWRVKSFGGGDGLKADELQGVHSTSEVLGHLESYHLARARLQNPRGVPHMPIKLIDQYESWKSMSGLKDFSDLIDDAHEHVDRPPGLPRFMFVDEAQDHSAAEMRLIRKWGSSCEKLIIVGDPDQALYTWRGGDPEVFYAGNLPADQKRVLSKSYRVPEAIHKVARTLIMQVADREDAPYHPRDARGEVQYGLCGYDQPGDVIDDYLARSDGRCVMFLASCSYMLKGIIDELRHRLIPFWNPYRAARSDWNPIGLTKGGSSANRMRAFLIPNETYYGGKARLWSWAEFWHWVEVTEVSKWLNRGAKGKIEGLAKNHGDEPIVIDTIREMVKDTDTLNRLSKIEPEWLAVHVTKDRREAMEYMAHMVRRHGLSFMTRDPEITVGTIHSVKGGESDVVYLSPDISYAAYTEFQYYNGSVCRCFYVGMTRARESLVLCEPSRKSKCIEW